MTLILSTPGGHPAGIDTGLPAAEAAADAAANPTTSRLGACGERFNGASWDRERGTEERTLFASAARTATVNGADQVNYNHRGLIVVVDVTAVVDTPSVVFTIQGKDEVSGKYYTLLASAAITGTGTTVLRVYPGLTAAANLVATTPRTAMRIPSRTASERYWRCRTPAAVAAIRRRDGVALTPAGHGAFHSATLVRVGHDPVRANWPRHPRESPPPAARRDGRQRAVGNRRPAGTPHRPRRE